MSNRSASRASRLRASKYIIKGTFIHTPIFGEIEVIQNGAIFFDENGIIQQLVDTDDDKECFDDLAENVTIYDYSGKMIMPGFIDAHCHAPQYVFTGTGMDLQLLPWLTRYTFPAESKFTDLKFAESAYRKAVNRHLSLGTTFASYFATIHNEACKVLVDVIEKAGQRAYVGKVSMDRNAPDFYVEQTGQAIQDADDFAKFCLERTELGRIVLDNLENNPSENEKLDLLNNAQTPRILPVITPRFVPTCTSELMKALGKIAKKYCLLPIQSHLDENAGEIAWVAELHPESTSYTNVYEICGLCTPHSYMAHCVHCTPAEIDILRGTETGVVHCAASNFNLGSGICDVRKYLAEGVKICLGTDVAGGHSCGMLDAMRQSFIASRSISFMKREKGEPYEALNYKEIFYLATQGGAEVMSMGDMLGTFARGKKLDCLVVDPMADNSPFDVFGLDDQLDIFQKFLFLGDDRNIVGVFVDGKKCIG